MTHRRILSVVAGTLIAVSGAAGVAAQNVVLSRTQQPRAYLGFSYEEVLMGPRGNRTTAIVVREIVEDSPAERAGLAVDDTVLSINDIRVSNEFVASLATSLVPGDRVRLRVRRAGRERDVTVEAGERPSNYGIFSPRDDTWSFQLSPDSLRGQMRLYLDSALVALDTMRLPDFRIEATPRGGVWMFRDSSRFELMPDSMWSQRGALIFPHDSAFFRNDSTWLRRIMPGGVYSFRGDSLYSILTDSAWARASGRGFSFQLDSLATLRYRAPDIQGGRILGLRGDSLFTYETLPGGVGIATFGMRAIGGAELTELNEGLGDYFGVDEGVLVVRVPDRTPAARAGLEAGDVIVRVNDRDVASVSELRRAIGRTGEPIRLEVVRRNARRTIEMRE